MKNLLPELIKTFGIILEEKSPELKRHSDRVASLSVSFARNVAIPGLNEKELYLAGLLHDFGQIFLEPSAMNKPGLLTAAQLRDYRHHPRTGVRLLSHVSAFKEILPIIRHHHEHYDGSGFPDALRGDMIPAGARIIGLVDHYDRVMSGWIIPNPTVEVALRTIRKSAGSYFDPHLVELFVSFILSEYGGQNTDDADKEGQIQPRDIVQTVVRKIKAGDAELKVLPEVFHKVESAINNPHAVDDIIHELEKDAAISLKLISVANSSFYGGIERITSVRTAVTRLGLKEVRNIVASIALKGLYRTRIRRLQKMMQELWLRSLAYAYTARAIAQRVAKEESENLYMSGLFSEIGKVQILGLLPEKPIAKRKLAVDELMAVIDEFHADIAAFIIQYWGLDRSFSLSATPADEKAPGTSPLPFDAILSLTEDIICRMGYNTVFEDGGVTSAFESAAQLDLSASTIDRICREVEMAMESCVAIF